MKSPLVVYQIVNTLSGKKYIGKTKNLKVRWYLHRRQAIRKENLPLYNAINKYGIEHFICSILSFCKTEKELNKREIDLIDEHNTLHPNGYNLTAGGSGGDTFSNLSPTAKRKRRNQLSKCVLQRNKEVPRKSNFEYWAEIYGTVKANKLRLQHIAKISRTKRFRKQNPYYRKKLHDTYSKAIKDRIHKDGISKHHRQLLSEHNKVRFRKVEIVNMLDGGKSIREIACYFGISPYTIERKLKLWHHVKSGKQQINSLGSKD